MVGYWIKLILKISSQMSAICCSCTTKQFQSIPKRKCIVLSPIRQVVIYHILVIAFFFQEKKKTYFHIMNKKKGMQYYIQIQHTNLRKSRNWNYPWKKTKLPNPWHTRKQNEISMIFLVIRFRFLEPNGTIIFPLCLPSLSPNPEYCSAFACIFHTISYQQEGYNSTHLATISFFVSPRSLQYVR